MSLLIKNAVILDEGSPFNGGNYDVKIHHGKITAIEKKIDAQGAKVIKGKELYLSLGWVDVMADYGEPGYEQKETIATGLKAATAGGFSDVMLVPNTLPVVHTAPLVEFLRTKNNTMHTRLHVIGAVSKQTEGKELSEMIDMHHAGAIAFSDGWKPIQNAQLLLKALEYVKAFDGIIIQLPVLNEIAHEGLMNEGEVSVRLGMPGIPTMAESLLVHRDLEILRYTESKLHFSGISTEASLKLIRAAKKEGLKITCSVTPYHLLFTEDDLVNYESVFKVSPPLRSKRDRKALIKGVLDGTIDCIASHHRPHEWDAKALEFEYASIGMSTQETVWSMLLSAAPEVSVKKWIELLVHNPRKIFGIGIEDSISEGSTAPLTVFDKSSIWEYKTEQKYSKAANSPWINKEIIGKIHLIH